LPAALRETQHQAEKSKAMPWPKDPLPILDHLELPPREENACLAKGLCGGKHSHPLNLSAMECDWHIWKRNRSMGRGYGIWGDGPCGAEPQ